MFDTTNCLELIMNRTLSERAAAWSAAHWKTAVGGWLALMVCMMVAGQLAGNVTVTDAQETTGETSVALQAIEDGQFSDRASETVMVTAPTSGAAAITDNTDAAATVEELVTALGRTKHVNDVEGSGMTIVSDDGRAALVTFTVAGNPDTAPARIAPAVKTVKAVAGAHPGVLVDQLGDASAEGPIDDVLKADFQRAELSSLPITFVILLIAFGVFIAAGIPVLLAFTSVLTAIGASALTSHLIPTTDTTASVILLMGMAVGVDYSLFYLKREREERAAGHAPQVALARAARSSGRAVLVSGITVIVSTGGLLLSGDPLFRSFGVGSMLVVAFTVIGSISVLPALLSRLGDRVERGAIATLAALVLTLLRPLGVRPAWLLRARERRTLLQRLATRSGSGQIVGTLLRPVRAHPAIATALCTSVLLVLAFPALGMRTGIPGIEGLPQDLPVIQSYHRIEQHFPGNTEPALLTLRGNDLNSADVRAAVARLGAETKGTDLLSAPGELEVSADGTIARINVPIAGSGSDDRSRDAVTYLRTHAAPDAFAGVEGVTLAVAGDTADSMDYTALMHRRLPLVFLAVLGMSALVLLFTFRSLVVPAVAIGLNLLSVAAAFGVVTWIFQLGHLGWLLGFTGTSVVVSWLPLFMFAVLFGLSMDYHVFIVSRIRELVERGHSDDEAIVLGVRQTASTVTSAAFVMIAVFAVFATLSLLEFKQMGVGLAIAILIDATLIRLVLLPATMLLLGRHNWYLPRALNWLPRVELEHELDGQQSDAMIPVAGQPARIPAQVEVTA